MKTKEFRKRFLAMLLALIITLTLVPVNGIETQAAENDSFISMPITIRDYAADGMLFEFNQVGATGTTTVGNASNTMNVKVNPDSFNNDNYSWICVFNNRANQENGVGIWWLDIYCNADGTINRIYKSGTPIADTTIPSGGMYISVHSNCYQYYDTLNSITDANKGNYIFTLSGSTLTMIDTTVGKAGTYHQADTAGFSLLSTGDADYINSLPTDESKTIPGTTLIQNGSWGLKTDPDPITTTLSSGAQQQVYGAWIRTNLVQPTLVNGEMVYTEATVKYLAEYMQQLMVVPEQNTDGSYNTYFVTGHKLSELGGEDLAAKIRSQVKEGLGTYASAKSKFEAGNLKEYTGITTYYDAAYFLLHNIFNDNTGYGYPVGSYKNLNLVQTTNDSGEICYEFNSKYDDTKYDYVNGVIQNTQTDTFTIAKTNSGTESYVRGNALPEDRFDPLGMSGAGRDLGYGMSGDVYGDMVSESTADWNTFYDNTNYNLSLEGHAKFIYYEDSDLYFTFTGDDDVYLFINGICVLDVGAAHSISKVKINLNDVSQLCGLKDGQAYDFDFFYMERHGTAANFGIETNIRIVDPSMLTTKTGYQNGVPTGYNGFVDPTKKVGYSFELQNNGDAKIRDLTFDDKDIGVTFTKDDITLNTDSSMNEMYAILYNPDGTTKNYYKAGELTESFLKEMLANGLEVGEKIGIYGFKYMIPNDKWVSNVFTNTVYTTAVSTGENASIHKLNGIADWKVQKKTMTVDSFHVYEWMGHGVTVNKAELIQPAKDAGYTIDENGINIVLCTASGNETAINLNPNAKLNNDDSITYTGTATGLDTVFYKVKGFGYDNVVFQYQVYSYNIADNTYVLDYGLPVNLTEGMSSLVTNDVLYLAENTNTTISSLTGVSEASNTYGKFSFDETKQTLVYTPDKIINDTDSINVQLQVLEEGASELTKFTGVKMTEKVTTAPASVVYYEDNFEGLVYVDDEGNQWVTFETEDAGDSMQSADQESNYGSDPNYDADKQGDLVANTDKMTAEEKQQAQEVIDSVGGQLTGDASNGTITVNKVEKTREILHFTFEGTGFEIVSRTTSEDYAVLSVAVTDTKGTDSEEDDEIVKRFPVITECEEGDLYQVPVISVTDLPAGTYKVSLTAAASTSTTTRLVYIDGIRIFGALEGKTIEITTEEGTKETVDKKDEYYSDDEKNAEFIEVKDLIENGQAVVADVYMDDDDKSILISGLIMIETYGQSEEDNGEEFEGSILSAIEDVDEYLECGPNNELYLSGDNVSVMGFYLTPDENVAESERTVQIGAHRKADANTEDSTGAINLVYADTAEAINNGTSFGYSVSTGTEQYYTIDVDNLVYDEINGRYLVLIGIDGGDSMWVNTLALTSLKVSGYTITSCSDEITDDYGLEEPSSLNLYYQMNSYRLLKNPVEEQEKEKINEKLQIKSASFNGKKVNSGKAVTLTVSTTDEAEEVIIYDADGNKLENVANKKKTHKNKNVFTLKWNVSGKRGETVEFKVKAVDAEGAFSANEMTVSITIR